MFSVTITNSDIVNVHGHVILVQTSIIVPLVVIVLNNIEGSFTNVVGLPVEPTQKKINEILERG